ncbi:MAG: group 1 truncated hemoglobin, partial [Phaeodactylibacter sp.]|nr:group 1 truncated hemoglobin [Phaeodactylibacter sp.]
MIETKSLFEQIGGMPAVNAAVDIFYSKVVADPLLKPFFIHIDMVRQSGKLKAFLAYAFGAPMAYTGKNMR